MPTRNATASQETPRSTAVQWTGLLLNDDGSWFLPEDRADRTIHVRGTFGGATVTFQGSNEPGPVATTTPASGVVLTDQAGAPLSFTAAGARVVAEASRWVRPLVTGGDGTTSLTVDMIARQ